MMTRQQPDYVDATMYVQLAPEWDRWGHDDAGNQILEKAKLANATIKKPEVQKPGTVLLKLTVRVPAGAFLPLAPQAVVVIPEGMTVTEPIEVEAGDLGDEA